MNRKSIFIDTSAFYALEDINDENNTSATKIKKYILIKI